MPLVERLAACGAVQYGSFTLTSGQTSSYYVDVKKALCDPLALKDIATAMAAIADEHGPFDAVAGMELGAIPLATAVSLEAMLPMLMIRKGERAHGTGKRIEGAAAEGLRVLVVEDVTTSGGSTLDAVKVLRAAGATVDTATVVVDRQSGGSDLLNEAGVALHPLVTAEQLLEAKA